LAAALTAAGVLLLVLVLGAGILLVQLHRQQDVVTDRYFTIVNDSNDLFVDVVDAETAVRGYLLTGDRSTLAPLNNLTSPAARDESNRLRAEVDGDADMAVALQAAGAAVTRWYNEFAGPSLAAVQQRGPRAVPAAEVQRGKILFDRVRVQYRSYLDTVLDRRQRARDTLSSRTNLLSVVLGVGAVGAIGIGVLLWLALRRWVTRPLARLGEEARTVSAGELEHAVSVQGPPEIVALGDDVESMRRRLLEQLAQVEAVRDGLESARERLQAQAAELQRSNRDLEQFAYVASHDLQEPLRKVASFCQLLERRYAGKLDERADQYIAFAVDGAKRMQQLINDLLAFSRIGRRTTGRGEVSLQECLDGARRNLAAVLEETGAEVLSDPLPTVWGEKALLTALLQNLLSNALKFRGDDPVLVRVSVRADGDFYVFSCSDNGIGIEPQYAERIFVIFQRLHGKEQYSGTGIGLALCKKIVEWHGGRIWLDTDNTGIGRGTTFAWTLPVTERGRTIMDPAPESVVADQVEPELVAAEGHQS
jgi:signal transduction histidine kinase